MKNNITEIVFILDKSGSMCGLERDTIGGFNSMLHKQKKEEGKAFVSTVLFSTRSTVIHDRVDIDKVSDLTREDYFVGGGTALLDAMGDAIHHIGNVHKYARREDVPEHTIFVIITDGFENASTRYTKEKVQQIIRRQNEKYGWEFLFLGANIDAVQTASSLGIRPECAANFHSDSQGTQVNYEAISDAVCCARAARPIDGTWKRRIDHDFASRRK